MSPEIMEVVVEEREQEFVRMVSSKSPAEISIPKIENLHASHECDEVDRKLEDWFLQGDDISPAIHTAVKCGHLCWVLDNYNEFEANIDIDKLISSHTLHLAAAAGYHEIVHLLITHIRKNHPERLQQLINGRDSMHWTALHWACQNGHTQAGKVLIDSYKQITLDFPSQIDVWKDTESTTLLHLAVKPSGEVENPVMDMAKSDCKNRVALVDLLLLEWPNASEMLNKKDWQGNTPLHLAVEVMDVDIVELLVKQPRLIGTVKNIEGKTPSGLVFDQLHSAQTKELASVKIIQKYLSRLDDVRDEHQELIDERAMYYNAANNLLVGGTLLAGVSFSGILSMVVLPDELLTTVDPLASSPGPTPWAQFADLSPGPPPSSSASSTPHSRQVENVMDYRQFYIRAVDAFRGSNNMCFYFSIVTIMVAIRIMISRPRNIPLETEISRLRKNIVHTSLAFTFSTIFAFTAFISGGLANIPVPESGWAYVLSQWAKGESVAILKSTMLTSTMVGIVILGPMLIIPYILVPLLLDYSDILGAYLQHARGAVRRWRPLLTLVLAIFLVVGLIIFIFILFGVGLSNIELPPAD